MGSKNKMNILYQSDDRYAWITGVSLTSLLENNRNADEIQIYLIDDHISPENREKLLSLALRYGRSLTFLGMDDISEHLKSLGAPKWSGSYTTYGKLFAMGMIREELDRLLYLDSDTIVTADLSELYHSALGENVCAMVQDTAPLFVYKHIGHSKADPYFNAGVILLDMEKWKRLDCEASVFPCIRGMRKTLCYADQDVLNCLLKDKIKKLSPKYNFFVFFFATDLDEFFYTHSIGKVPQYYSKDEIRQAGECAAIYHYLAYEKPWVEDNCCLLAEVWEFYLERSPWQGAKKLPKRETASIRIQRFVNKHSCTAAKKALHLIYQISTLPALRWLTRI